MQGNSTQSGRGARRLAAFLLALPIGAAVTHASFQEDSERSSEVRWYDVRALETTGLQDPEGVDLRLHISSAFLDQLEPDSYDVPLESPPRLNNHGWSGLLWDCLGEDWQDDELSIEQRAGFLRVEGHEATQVEVASILADLEAWYLAEIEVELYLLTPDSIPADQRSLLDAAETEALLGQARVIEHARSSARPGHRLRLGVHGTDAALIDYDVEVASTARTADPQVTVLRPGTELGAVARPIAGGGCYLRAWGRRGVRVPDRPSAELGGFAGAPIEQPAMSTDLCAGSAVVPDGGGMLLGQNWNDNGVWLVRARRRASKSAGERAARFTPLGSLTTTPLIVRVPQPRPAQPSGGFEVPEETFVAQLDDGLREAVLETEDLFELLSEEREEGDLGGTLLSFTDSLYVRGSDALQQRARALVEEWSARLCPGTVELDLRMGIVARDRARALLADPDPARTELLAVLDRQMQGTCRLGDALMITGGVESLYLQDHDVEIAERSAIPDPIPSAIFEGGVLWCLPAPTSTGELSCWFDLLVQQPARETTRARIAHWQPPAKEPMRDETTASPGSFELSGELELPATARAGIRSRITCADGEWTLVGCTPLAGSDQSVLVLARLQLVPTR